MSSEKNRTRNLTITLRVTSSERELFLRGAEKRNMTLTDFLVSAALYKPSHAIKEYKAILKKLNEVQAELLRAESDHPDYKNFFDEKDHRDIHDLVVGLKCPWMITYDNAPEIHKIYSGLQAWQFDMVYGVANSGLNSEILFISDVSLLPEKPNDKKIKINLRQL